MGERLNNYEPPISNELRKRYEYALSQEFRWLNGMQRSNVPENDLQHVGGMFDKDHEISIKCPNLHREVAVPERLHMIYIHDAGELLAHDLNHSVPNYDTLRPIVKKREAAAVRLLTGKYIQDPDVKSYARDLYRRYENKRPDDIIAQYVQLLDKTQGLEFGAKHVFSGSRLLSKEERLQQVEHVYGLLITPARNLIRLIGVNAQDELVNFLDDQFHILKENGYREDELNYYRNQLKESLNNEVTFA